MAPLRIEAIRRHHRIEVDALDRHLGVSQHEHVILDILADLFNFLIGQNRREFLPNHLDLKMPSPERRLDWQIKCLSRLPAETQAHKGRSHRLG